MQGPPLKYKQFLFLAGLINGEVKTRNELMDSLAWSTAESHISIVARVLHNRGLITRNSVLMRAFDFRMGQPRVHRRNVCRITKAGRRAWQETLDWYLFIAGRYEGEGDSLNLREIISAETPIAPTPMGAVPGRFPTKAEAKRILKIASAEFARFYRVMLASGASVIQLAALDIEQVDLNAKEIVLAEDWRGVERLKLNKPVRGLLIEAMGDRVLGPVFLTVRKRRWTTTNFRRRFFDLRNAAGINRNVKIRGHKTGPRSVEGV